MAIRIKKRSRLAISARRQVKDTTRMFLKEQEARREAQGQVVDVSRQRVHGKLVRSVGYDATTQTMQVEFTGGVYDYLNVKEERYYRFLESEDADEYFKEEVKSHYMYQRCRRR